MRGECDDALRRTLSLQEAETLLKKADIRLTDEAKETLAGYIEERKRLEEQLKEANKNASGRRDKQLEAEQRLQEQVIRTYIELLRQADALRVSSEEHENVADAIDAENMLLAANIDLQSELGQQLLRQIDINQELAREVDKLKDNYDKVKQATKDVESAFSEFAATPSPTWITSATPLKTLPTAL